MKPTDRMQRSDPSPHRPVRRLVLAALMAFGLVAGAAYVDGVLPTVAAQTFCGLRYVASGDDVPAGHDVTETERYSHHLWEDHLKTWGQWCEFNIAKNGTTSATLITAGQLAQTWNYRPDLITLTVGEQNTGIVKLITECFDNVKDHEFTEATACASAILGNTALFTQLNLNLTTTLQQYRMIMAGRPALMVAVTGYPNPYPKSLDVSLKLAPFCAKLEDTIPTCIIRWVQLPPALQLIDEVFKKLNTTIENAVKPFTIGSGGRFIFVNTYDKTRDHCMKMEVEIKTKVYHPPNTVHEHNTDKTNFGCSDPWYVAGEDGHASPFLYLTPAVTGVLIFAEQTTSGMGVYPNDAGHKCISDLIWEADTPEPGTTPLKWKLRVPEAPKSDICQ